MGGARRPGARPGRPGPSPAPASARPAGAHAATPAAQPDPGRPDQRATVAQAAGHDPRPPGERNPAERIHLRLGPPEEGLAETQRHRSAHHGQRKVEQDRHRRDGAADEHAGALHPFRWGQPRRLPGQGLQRRARRLRLETAPAAARAATTVGDDDDVADVARVAEPAVEQPAVEHDAAAHPGRHDHGDVVVVAGRRADPPFAERQRLRIVVHERRQPRQGRQPRPQGKGPPPRDVQRRHLLAAGAHRPAAPGAADHEAVPGSHQPR